MQGLDFKAEIDRRCGKVLASISARMGFVPSGILKTIQKLKVLKYFIYFSISIDQSKIYHLCLLKILKAPGDPSYDSARASDSRRYRSSSPSLRNKQQQQQQQPEKVKHSVNKKSKAKIFEEPKYNLRTNYSDSINFENKIDEILNSQTKYKYENTDQDDDDEDDDDIYPEDVMHNILGSDDSNNSDSNDSTSSSPEIVKAGKNEHAPVALNTKIRLSPESKDRVPTNLERVNGVEDTKQYIWSKWDAKLELMGR